MKKIGVILCFSISIVVIAMLMKYKTSGLQIAKPKTENSSFEAISQTVSEMTEGFGELSESVDKDTMDEVMSYVKEKSEDGSFKSREGIKQAIEEAEEKYDFSVSDNTKEQIAEAVDKLEDMGFSTESVVEKTEGLYDKYGADFVDHMEEAFIEAARDAAENAAKNAWDGAKDGARELISGILY